MTQVRFLTRTAPIFKQLRHLRPRMKMQNDPGKQGEASNVQVYFSLIKKENMFFSEKVLLFVSGCAGVERLTVVLPELITTTHQ